jgi:DNA-binding CsgD family transcriptional regulator
MNHTDGSPEGEIGDIILKLWKEGMSLSEIAQEIRESVGLVNRILKKIQKKIVDDSE